MYMNGPQGLNLASILQSKKAVAVVVCPDGAATVKALPDKN